MRIRPVKVAVRSHRPGGDPARRWYPNPAFQAAQHVTKPANDWHDSDDQQIGESRSNKDIIQF
jgi:hypothetical protein